MRMARCCTFVGPVEDGGVSRGESPVGVSGFLGWPGCALVVGPDRRRWGDK